MQLKQDKLENMEMEVERKRAEITEKLMLADQKLADMQSKISKKEARNKRVLGGDNWGNRKGISY